MAGMQSIKNIAHIVHGKYGLDENMVMAQLAHESGWGESRLAKENGNYGGLTQSTPNGEENKQPDGNAYYRVFNSDEEYADAYWNDYLKYYDGILDAHDARTFATILHNNGYYTADPEDYISSMESILGEDFSNLTYVPGAGTYTRNNYLSQLTADNNWDRPWGNSLGDPDSLYYQRSSGMITNDSATSVSNDGGFLADIQRFSDGMGAWADQQLHTFKDAFVTELQDSIFGRLVNRGMDNGINQFLASKMNPAGADMIVSDDDIAQARQTLGIKDNDVVSEQYKALMYAQANAQNKAHFDMIVNSKKAYFDRQKALEQTANTGAKFLGNLTATAIDPINFIPVAGEEAFIAKLGAKYGVSTLTKLGAKSLTKYAEIGVANGLINVADVKGRELLGGREESVANAFVSGTVASMGLSLIAHPFIKALGGKALKHEEEKLMKNSLDSIAELDQKALKNKDLFSVKLQLFSDKYNLNGTVEALGRFIKANRKSKAYNNIKQELSDSLDRKLSNTDLDNIADQLAKGKQFHEVVAPLHNGESLVGGRVHGEHELVSKALHDSPIFEELPFGEVSQMEDQTRTIYRADDGLTKEPLITEDKVRTIPRKKAPTEPVHLFTKEVKGIGERNINNRVTPPEEVAKQTQTGFLSKIPKIGQWLDRGALIGDVNGLLMNSTSDTLRAIGKFLHRDTRQRSPFHHMDVETAKTVVKNEYTPLIDNIFDTYKEYIHEKGWYHLPSEEQSRLWSMEVTDAYHAIYRDRTAHLSDYSESIQKAVEGLRAFRQKDKQMMVNAKLIDDFTSTRDELTRIPDISKLEYVRTLFNDEDSFQTFMKDYFLQAIDRDRLLGNSKVGGIVSELDVGEDMIKALNPDLIKENGDWIDITTGEVLSEKDITQLIKEAIPTRADEIIEEIATKLTKFHTETDAESLLKLGDGKQSYWKSRISLDYNVQHLLPDGNLFNYDSIRMKDIPMLTQYVANRSSGAIAFKQAMGITDVGKDLRKYADSVRQELGLSVNKGYISQSQADREIDALEQSLEGLSGALLFDRPHGNDSVLHEVSRLVRSLSYGANMMNAMGNQLSEGFGAIAINGKNALLHYIPALKRRLEDLSDINLTAEQKQKFMDEVLGYENAHDRFYNPDRQTSYAREGLELRSNSLKLLGKIGNVADTLSTITSKLNMMNPLTTNSIRLIQADLFTDLIRYSQGKFKSTLRKNIFSDEHFAKAGITDVEGFLATIRKYTSNGRLDMQKWAKEDFTSYLQLKGYLQNESQNIIIQPNIGSSNLESKHWFLSLLMQFRNFSRTAVNQHVLRVLSNPEREHATMLLATAIPAGMYWAMRERLRAEEKFEGKDQKKKQEWIDKHITAENIITAGLLRSNIGSGFGYAQDAYSILTGADSYKTTVATYADDSNPISRMVESAPPIAMAWNATKGSYDTLSSLVSDGEVSAKASRELNKVYPIKNFLPIRVLTATWADTAEKDKKQQSAMKNLQKHRENIMKSKERKGKHGKATNEVQEQSVLKYLTQ